MSAPKTSGQVPVNRSPLDLTIWLIVCAWLGAAGWILSALGQLDRAGWAVVLAMLGVVLWRCVHERRHKCRWKLPPRRRWCRTLPAAWLTLAALVWLGGILHAPNNFDALAYRVPRVLHWLAEGHWHWIHTDFGKINTRSIGYEWLMAPLMALQGTERWTWLFNGLGFLLLPGRIFAVFTRLGIGARATWHWMWVLPGAYCFALQGGGIGNDMMGALFALAMMELALRARTSASWGDGALAVIAGALMTGIKASNLPLLLPGALTLAPCWRLMRARPFGSLAVAALALLVSFAPVAFLNWRHTGDWTGTRYESTNALAVTPAVGLIGNTLHLAAQNLVPPILPGASRATSLLQGLIPESLRSKIAQQFEAGGIDLPELQNEERAAFGMGTSLLVLATIFASGCCFFRQHGRGALIRWAPFVSLLVFMAKNGLSGAGRIVAPYYLLLLPALLVGAACDRVVCTRWWRRAALVTLALTALLTVATPSRPLWPAVSFSEWLGGRFPTSGTATRIHTVYSVYAQRSDALAAVRDMLPADEPVIGFVTSDDPETSLWRPFGSRRIWHVARGDTAGTLRTKGVRTVVVSAENFDQHMGRTFAEWLDSVDGEVIASRTLRTRAGHAPWDWHVVRLREDAVGRQPAML
jgi:hypothetical protein